MPAPAVLPSQVRSHRATRRTCRSPRTRPHFQPHTVCSHHSSGCLLSEQSHGRRRRPPPLRAPHGGAGSRAPRLRTGALSLSGHQALQEVAMGPALCAAGGARAPRGPGGHGRQQEARADVPASPRCRLKHEPASWCGGPALPGAERGHPLGGGSPRPPQTTPRKRSARLRPALRGPPALWALGGQHCLPAPAGHLLAPS